MSSCKRWRTLQLLFGHILACVYASKISHDAMQALRKDNVKVMLINPGPIATFMTKVSTTLHLHAPAGALPICYTQQQQVGNAQRP